MGKMTLGELISGLESMDQSMIVEGGFGCPHSDRGYYQDLAFDPKPTARISDMLEHAKAALGATFSGWKGGEFTMNEWTDVHIGKFGECGEPITSAHFKLWELTGRKE